MLDFKNVKKIGLALLALLQLINVEVISWIVLSIAATALFVWLFKCYDEQTGGGY